MAILDYPMLDSNLSFSSYISKHRDIIINRRLIQPFCKKSIIEANCPYELFPDQPIYSNNRLKYGALLIHGLLDCPFSLKDIGLCLQEKGILTRAILLPGHGTIPSDLLHVSYHDWIREVRYGVETLRQEVENIFLIGYSTGATLSIYEAMHDAHIKGIILLAPAIKIKAPIDYAVGWQSFLKMIRRKNNQWFYQENETDYTKYLSIPFNAINQVSKLTTVISELNQSRSLSTPTFIVMSKEDETVSSSQAIHFFSNLSNQHNRMLLYSAQRHSEVDPRIISRQSHYPDLNIKHLSHIAIPFSPYNPHYGKIGDYSIWNNKDCTIYGAYNRLEIKLYAFLYKLKLLKKKRRELTYNPDFAFMMDKILHFILK